MIHVEYEKKGNFPHDREIILFDRDAFQSLGDEGLRKVNKIYNVLCPPVFIVECLAPNRATDEEKKWLLNRLKLIENPLVFIGDTNISPIIDIPRGAEYSGILSSEQIARNCIISKPITMERVTPEKLIEHYNLRVNVFKNSVKRLTETCELYRGHLTTKPLISRAKRHFQQKIGASPSEEEIRRTIKKYKHIFRAQAPNDVAKLVLQTVESMPISWHIEKLKDFFLHTDKDTSTLLNQVQDRERLTPKNYPDLAYPIYIYYLMLYMIYARQHNTQHLDQSYVRDFRYLHYLNFCDFFITNEKSASHIVNSIPYGNIKETRIMTSDELKSELQI